MHTQEPFKLRRTTTEDHVQPSSPLRRLLTIEEEHRASLKAEWAAHSLTAKQLAELGQSYEAAEQHLSQFLCEPSQQPSVFVGNEFGDKYFRLYPPKKQAQLPLPEDVVAFLELQLAAYDAKQRFVQALHDACSQPASDRVNYDFVHIGSSVVSRVLRVIEARWAPSARQRSFFKRTVQWQRSATDDFRFLSSSSVETGRASELLEQLDRAGVKTELLAQSSNNIAETLAVSVRTLTSGQLATLLLQLRVDRKQELDASLFPFHEDLVACGLLERNLPATDDEIFRRELARIPSMPPPESTKLTQLPWWAATAIAHALGCELLGHAGLTIAKKGLEGYSRPTGTLFELVGDLDELEKQFQSSLNNFGSQEEPLRPPTAGMRARWHALSEKLRCVTPPTSINVAGITDPDESLPTPFGLQIGQPEHSCEIPSPRAEFMPFRLAVPLCRPVHGGRLPEFPDAEAFTSGPFAGRDLRNFTVNVSKGLLSSSLTAPDTRLVLGPCIVDGDSFYLPCGIDVHLAGGRVHVVQLVTARSRRGRPFLPLPKDAALFLLEALSVFDRDQFAVELEVFADEVRSAEITRLI